jgi:peptidoglycan-N-acetylglucosamine deacetylase
VRSRVGSAESSAPEQRARSRRTSTSPTGVRIAPKAPRSKFPVPTVVDVRDQGELGRCAVTALSYVDKFRSVVPRRARERLYEWHPGRARRWRRHRGVERVEPRGCAVLTFDDGPDEDATPAVLDALDECRARATFFVLASQLHSNPDLGQEVLSRGHEIGLHGYDHERHDRIEPERSRADVMRGFEAVANAVGIRCRWYRPPFGKMSEASAEACRALGMTPVYWSAWGLDWEDIGAARVAGVASEQLDDGAILLLHDSARYGRRPSAAATAEAIPVIAASARERDISLISLGQAVQR